jgi:anaerobic selenocysteine-containing dehydrogenase
MLKAAPYIPPHELPSQEYPFLLDTGRTVYHFHTRTKTARAPQLQAAAPEVWVELSPGDADRLGIVEGDLVEVASPRGSLQAWARITAIREGVVFVPFHYTYWDEPGGDTPSGAGRAANELTITDWDPVSKQPYFKTGTVRVTKIAASDGRPSPAPVISAPPARGRGLRVTSDATAVVSERIEEASEP